MGKHHGHGGHRHHHGGRGVGFYPAWIYELECDPSDPYYMSCITRFGGNDFNGRPPGSMSPVGDEFHSRNAGKMADVGYDVFFGYNDEIRAIRAFFDRTEAKTAEAAKIKDDFIKWYDGLWITANYVPQSDYDLARNQRNRFNLANATTLEEKTAVQEVIQTGLSTEQTQGDPDRRLSGGMLPGPVTPPKPPLIPDEYKLAAAVVGGLAILAMAYGYGRS
jgi:hypothetical protein